MSAHSNQSSTDRLLQLSDEVSRIAGTLARLSTDPAIAAPDGSPEVPIKHVQSLMKFRRLRSRYFSEDIFADPAWDMMLSLFHAELAQHRMSVSQLTAASQVPTTTAIRWMNALVDQGILVRRPDPCDARRVFVELTPETSASLRQYFRDLVPLLAV
jgi:DNA-binding MarR family transcriptional regulator